LLIKDLIVILKMFIALQEIFQRNSSNIYTIFMRLLHKMTIRLAAFPYQQKSYPIKNNSKQHKDFTVHTLYILNMSKINRKILLVLINLLPLYINF
jgi:hypothetical protein